MARSTSQNQSQLAGSQRRSSTQRRDLTPERPFVPSTDSRDELARTASHHNGRRQKRPVSELEDDISEPEEEEEDEQSPSISPIKVLCLYSHFSFSKLIILRPRNPVPSQ